MRLIDCFVKILAYTVRLRDWKGEVPPAVEDVQTDVTAILAEADRDARRGGFGSDDYQTAKFAVCAFVDETVMLSDWEGRLAWAPLQRRIFNTTNAGEEFFTILDGLPIANKQLREVFAACLALGFTGRYFLESDKQVLEGLKAVALTTILPDDEEPWKDDLLPEAYPGGHGAVRNRLWGRLSRWTILLIILPPALLVTLFAIYRFMLGRVIYDFFTSAL